MPASRSESSPEFPQGTSLAIVAETLYLVNLMIAPGLAFIILLILYLKHAKTSPPIAAAHLTQTVVASLWAGVMLVIVNLAIILLGGYDGPYTWMVVILYFTIAHSTLILLGVIGLSKSMAGQCWRYPLFGRPLPAGCK